MYILAWLNTTLGLYECFHLSPTGLSTFLDPTQATTFTTRALAEVKLPETTGTGLEVKVVVLTTAQAKYTAKVVAGFPQREFPLKNPHSRKYAGESAADILKWRMTAKLAPANTIATEDYMTWPMLYTQFKNIFDHAGYVNKDYTKHFHTVQMLVRPTDTFEVFKKELALVLPYITHKTPKGDSIIDMSYLSENYDPHAFTVNVDGSYSILATYFSKPTVVKTGGLKEMFLYWQSNYPYKTE